MFVDMIVKIQFYSDCNNFKKNKEEIKQKIRECSFVDMHEIKDTRKEKDEIIIFTSR